MLSFSLINNVCAERILYIYDIKEQYFKDRLQYNPRSPQLVSSLISSFSWTDTKEGYDFWNNIWEQIRDYAHKFNKNV